MKWRGRRQSTNIEDLRKNITEITLRWGGSAHTGYFIDTDGLVYVVGNTEQGYFSPASIGGTAIELTVIPSQPSPRLSQVDNEYSPNLTTAQAKTIRQIIINITNRSNVTINGADSYEDLVLWQYATAVLNGN